MKSTKELARQLGILRKRATNSQSDRAIKKTKKSNQIFTYLIVIDFESTCWRDKKTIMQEVIEFPAVLLNMTTGEIEAEFHTFVQPQENPRLSEFCRELTGISQEQVDRGMPLNVCLSQFTKWLKKLSEEKQISYHHGEDERNLCTFVTWSDWDLGVCLHYETRRKQLRKPVELNSWIDLRATYRKFYERKPNGLNGALQDLGIHFTGRQHSGLDDARNTARLAWRMICDGCTMNITKSDNRTPDSKNLAHIPSKSVYCGRGPSGVQSVHTKTNSRITQTLTSTVRELGIKKTPKSQSTEQPTITQNNHIKTQFVSQDDEISSSYVDNWKDFNSNQDENSSDDKVKGQRNIITPATVITNMENTITGQRSHMSIKTTLGKSNSTPKQTTSGNEFKKNVYTAVSSQNKHNTVKCFSTKYGKLSNQLISTEVAQSSCVRVTMDTCQRTGSTITDEDNTKKKNYESPNIQTYRTISNVEPSPLSKQSSNISNTCSKETNSGQFKTPLVPAKRPTNMYKTPQAVSKSSMFTTPQAVSKSTLFRTPQASHNKPVMLMGRVTPPLCQCGRRAKKRTVMNPGPNQGRGFFSCPTGRGGSHAKSCGFFRWEIPSSSR
ncbi:ERI1 exoribonuclease 2-like [Glandiceps talaboti]